MDLRPAKAEEMLIEQGIFNGAWALLKRYYLISPENETDQAWDEIVKGANDLYEIGKGTRAEELGKTIALGVIDHIERVYKMRRGELEKNGDRYNG